MGGWKDFFISALSAKIRKGEKALQIAFSSRPKVVIITIQVLTSILILLIVLFPRRYLPKEKYQVGDLALRTIKILRDGDFEDKVTTEQKKKLAADMCLPVYDYDSNAFEKASQKVIKFFQGMRELELAGQSPSSPELIYIPQAFQPERKEELISTLGVELTEDELKVLELSHYSPDLEEKLLLSLKEVYQSQIVLEKEFLSEHKARGITVRYMDSSRREKMIDFSYVLDLNGARAMLEKRLYEELSGYPIALKKVLIKIGKELIQPNLTFNQNETALEREKASNEVKPVFFKFKKGEVIVRKGDRINEEQWKKIQAVQSTRSPYSSWGLVFGIFILVLLSQTMFYQFARRDIKKFKVGAKDLIFLSSLMVVSLFVLKILEYIGNPIESTFTLPEGVRFYYLAGIAGGAMLVRMVLNSEVALVYLLLLSLFSALVVNFEFEPIVYNLVGGVVAISEIRHSYQRSHILRAGVALALANLILIFIFNLISGLQVDFSLIFYNVLFGLAGGFFSAVVVAGIIPLVEYVFGYTTDIRFLEYLNQEHPLLKELSLKAPGTYQHSLMTANLAEVAAEAIGVNPILVRAMAMYHDIGKIGMAHYFAENQTDGNNPHLKLKPTMSSLIIIKHVKEGVEKATRHRLPSPIIDAIQQHHGTSLVKYFYEQAKRMENPEIDKIEEQEFRYPGPKPQNRETAILMLSDIIESSARTIKDPNPAKLQGMVQLLIDRVFEDGQLSECELTLKDLEEMQKAFTGVLCAIYHSRPDYLEPVEKGANVAKKQSNSGASHQQTKNSDLKQSPEKQGSPSFRNSRT